VEFLVVGFSAISETNIPIYGKIWDKHCPYHLGVLTFLLLMEKITRNNPECLLSNTTAEFSFPV